MQDKRMWNGQREWKRREKKNNRVIFVGLQSSGIINIFWELARSLLPRIRNHFSVSLSFSLPGLFVWLCFVCYTVDIHIYMLLSLALLFILFLGIINTLPCHSEPKPSSFFLTFCLELFSYQPSVECFNGLMAHSMVCIVLLFYVGIGT